MAGKPQPNSARSHKASLQAKTAGSPHKAVVKYLRSVMLDKSNSDERRDKAALMLAQLVNQRLKIRMAKRALAGRKAMKKLVAERTKINTARRVEAAIGKKAVKQEGAQYLASNNEWDDLIPKAKVIPLRKAAK